MFVPHPSILERVVPIDLMIDGYRHYPDSDFDNMKIQGILRIDSEIEKEYFKYGGILNYNSEKF